MTRILKIIIFSKHIPSSESLEQIRLLLLIVVAFWISAKLARKKTGFVMEGDFTVWIVLLIEVLPDEENNEDGTVAEKDFTVATFLFDGVGFDAVLDSDFTVKGNLAAYSFKTKHA